ncbi:MAG: hypothetical protein H8K04_00285 [Nitrospira sp.]
MKYQLYMRTLDQEFSAETAAKMITRTQAWAWSNWSNWNNWNNWSNWNNFGGTGRPLSPMVERLKLRTESFGGLLFDPSTRRVFKLDQQAYEVLRTILKKDQSIEEVASQNGVPCFEVTNLLRFLSSFDE